MFIFYISGVALFQIILAWRGPDTDLKMAIWFSYLWPISIPFIIFIFVLGVISWECEINKSDKYIGFRRPNDNWPGFAISLFKYELQAWKKR